MNKRRRLHALAGYAAAANLLIGAVPAAAAKAECSSSVPGAAPIDPSISLRSRVGPPSPLVLDTYRKAGAADVAEHPLTDREWKQVDAALASLPPFQMEVLKRHLRRISFVSATTSMGTALTSAAETCSELPQFDITLRSTLFTDDLTTFLNRKEQGLFEDDGSGYRVQIQAGKMSALPYILLHEGTHVVDLALGIGALSPNAFRDGVWSKGRDFAPTYSSNAINGILWRGGKKIPLARAKDLYRELRVTPFVSNYAATAPGEDLAETLAWQQLSTRYRVKLRVRVRDGTGKRIYELEPLKSPLVKARFAAVEELLAGTITPAARISTQN